MRIVGLDLSLSATGVALLDTERGTLRTTTIATGTRKGHDRMNFIIGTMRQLISGADVAAIEGPSFGSKSQSQRGHHERAGLWWITAHMLWVNKIEYAIIPPSNRAMYATGNGLAKKELVLRDVRDRYGNICHTANDNEADALILAVMLAHKFGNPLVGLPPTHTRALAAVNLDAAPSHREKVARV